MSIILIFAVVTTGCIENITNNSSRDSGNEDSDVSGSKTVNISENEQSTDSSSFGDGLLGGHSGEAYLDDGDIIVKFDSSFEDHVAINLIKDGTLEAQGFLSIGETKTTINTILDSEGGEYKLVVIRTKDNKKLEEYQVNLMLYSSTKFKVNQIEVEDDKIYVTFEFPKTPIEANIYKDNKKIDESKGINVFSTILKGDGVYRFEPKYNENIIGEIIVKIRNKEIQSYEIN